MKFVCGTAELSEACLNVQRAVSTKTSIPAVEGILIKAVSGQLILTGYDLELVTWNILYKMGNCPSCRNWRS